MILSMGSALHILFTAEAQRSQSRLYFSVSAERPRRSGMTDYRSVNEGLQKVRNNRPAGKLKVRLKSEYNRMLV